ncbi:MAG: hypothetical protein P8188_20225, partial [Gemmatimonadota bacterium]
AKKTVEKATKDIPIVGDVVDKNVRTGPLDGADDALDDAKDRAGDTLKQGGEALDKGKDKLSGKKKDR